MVFVTVLVVSPINLTISVVARVVIMKSNRVVLINVVPLIVNGLNGASGLLAHVIVMVVDDAVHGPKELWVVDIRRNNRSSNILSISLYF